MNLTSYIAFGCMIDYIIQPKAEIFLPMYEQFIKVNQKKVLTIAIQIRAGDWYLSNTDHTIDIRQFHAYFHCAQQIEESILLSAPGREQYDSAIWYLVSDSLPLRKAAIEKYGHQKIITSLHTVIEHSSKEESVCKDSNNCHVSDDGFTTAAAEWWLMSFARYHVITRYSGYGRSAGMHSLYKDSIYTVMNGKAANSMVCNNQTYTDLETLSYEWSGI